MNRLAPDDPRRRRWPWLVAAVGATLAALAVQGWRTRPQPSPPATAEANAGNRAHAPLAEGGRPAAIAGQVRSADDRELPGSGVCLFAHGRDAEGGPPPREPTCVVAGRDGSFSFDGLAPGTYSLVASAPEWVSAAAAGNPGLDLAPGERREDVVLRLQKGGHRVAGVVEDGTGIPVALARLTLVNPSGLNAPSFTHTDAAGRFAISVARRAMATVGRCRRVRAGRPQRGRTYDRAADRAAPGGGRLRPGARGTGAAAQRRG